MLNLNGSKGALTVLSLVAVLATTSASAAPIDSAKSTVSATGKQLGVPVTGQFKKITGDVTFNPAQLAQSTAKVEIDVASYDMGMADYNKNVTGPEWFDAAKFPKASFVSTGIKAAGAGFTVTGKFTLKGRVQNVSFPVSVKTEGANQVFDGVLQVKRTAFGVGSGDWADTSVVADDVTIKFHIVAPAKK
ncbi:YceI family protein [Aquirhabdus parva]|uniref:Polyisoprenoid-binding protein n=1 Tax=Aquirhabdus parva TaxID=2283318 RepID=A0A345P7C6_9GAMM|nr:YceI family protein [Aquirhabdus parva]AXI03185.1 polyisoprenoid-binding protein [Aquirhabdus parva]